jgi:AraC family transcriptional regulator
VEPHIVHRQPFTVLGVLARCTPQSADFSDIWLNRFMARHDEISPHSTDGAFYGVDHLPGEDGTFEYIAGMAVVNRETVPEGLVLRAVPAARDAVCECTVATIGEAYERAFGEWLPASPYEHDRSLPGFEHYPPDTTTGDSPVLIHIPIQKRASR